MEEPYIDIEFLKMKGAIEELVSAIENEVYSPSISGENVIKLAQGIIYLIKEYYKPNKKEIAKNK